MKTSTTLTFALILAGLGVYYFAGEKYSPAPLGELSPVEVLLLAPEDRVTWFQIENLKTKETVALRRAESGWRLENPVSYPAEDLLARGMVAALARAKRLRRFPFNAHTALPKDLGLAPPSLRIAVETEKDPKRKYLWVGEDSPIGRMVYARWEGEQEYFLAPPEFRSVFERTAYSLRRKKLFRVNWEGVAWIEAKGPKRQYRLERNGKVWRAILPDRQVEIPLEKVTDLIYAFQSLYVKDFLDGKNPSNHELRLREGGASLALGAGEGTLEKLFLGASAKNQDALYACREKEDLVLLVSESNLRALWTQLDLVFRGLSVS